MRLESGNVLAAKMNSHRENWNGTICSQPLSWNCGADSQFKESYCQEGISRCFHTNVFNPDAPRFLTPDSTVVAAIERQPTLLNDQIVVFYGNRFGPQQGIAPGDYEQTLFGLYWIRKVSVDSSRRPHSLTIEPHKDGWALFPRPGVRATGFRSMEGIAYLKQYRGRALKDAIMEMIESSASTKPAGWTPELHRRLQQAGKSLPAWLNKAEQAADVVPEAPPRSFSSGSVVEGPLASKLKKLKIVPIVSDKAAPLLDTQDTPMRPDVGNRSPGASEPIEILPELHSEAKDAGRDRQPPVSGAAATELAPEVDGTTVQANVDSPEDTSHALPEEMGSTEIGKQFGASLVEALEVAFASKSLVILTGAPGAGKSWIASRLLDDPGRSRTVIVPVASTWRGREDLLGYVNPIDGTFQATEFTQFLCDCQDAWESGDRRARLVIFEEFNLSQPEHWLSDLLVRLEYEADQLSDRTVRLGGREISGRPGRSTTVVLVPSVRFAATLNNDHTVKPLSPRVLDRAALIHVATSGRSALARVGLELPEEEQDLVDELNELLEPRGAAFSVRSARSLQKSLQAGSTRGVARPRALDLVLAQEVFSRVRLLAGDPRDEQLLASLQAWRQKPACAALTACAARISDWAEALEAGRDVFQA